MTGNPPRYFYDRRLRAFTLTEMIVVIAVIVVLIGISIPAVRSLTGNRNTGAAFNQLNAIVGQARQDAMALQTVHGVAFYLDPNTDRITALFVQSVTAPTSLPAGMSTVNSPQVWLDTTPQREQVALPAGVGLQTIANPTVAPPNTGADRYLGFNPSANTCKYGGVILFDSNGRLTTQTYCLLCDALFGGGTISGGVYTPHTGQTGPVPNAATTDYGSFFYPQSQFGCVLFDRDAFLAQGYTTDGDDGFDSTVSLNYGAVGSTGTEWAEEQWLDQNSTPVLVNRYNGTLIKGE
jgi:prepilin-type N-terminal cleavage/methylation domain-containing protein